MNHLSSRSAQQCLLFLPKAKCITLGERAFSVAGPRERREQAATGYKASRYSSNIQSKAQNLPLFLALLSRVLLCCLVRLDFIDFIVLVLVFYL